MYHSRRFAVLSNLLMAGPVIKCANRRTGQTVLVRVYGKKSELLINRVAELEVGAQAH